jgi:hypothetical protein
MKKIIQLTFTVLALAFVFQACSTVKSLPAAATGASRARIVGTWTLTNINYDGLLPNAVQDVFNQAPPRDFIGSTWQLTNSGNGIYTLANGNSQTIFWSYNSQDKSNPILQFKKIFQGDKAKNVAEGYQLYITQNDGRMMTLKSPIAVGNTTAYIIYTFQKK